MSVRYGSFHTRKGAHPDQTATPCESGNRVGLSGENRELEKGPSVPAEGLDDYLLSHTSEDNASFNELWEEDIHRKRQEFRRLAAEASSSGVHGDKIKKGNGEMIDEVKTIEGSASAQGRMKAISMLYPEGQKMSVKELVARYGHQKVVHSNTRINTIPSSSGSSRIGKTEAYLTAGREAGEVVAIPGGSPIGGGGAEGTYGYVYTPSPMPGEGEDASPIMTWGTIDGTPFRLDGEEEESLSTVESGLAAPSPFRIPEVPKREQIAAKLVNEAVKKRKRVGNSSGTEGKKVRNSEGKDTFSRLASMSPAAQRLMMKSSGKSSGLFSSTSQRGSSSRQKEGLRSDFASELRSSYSPSPMRREADKN